MEDDALLKKHTDCVYFLASPLTCKKGNECEFRHSESARLNPRDCRYWINGGCLNWECPFRHPPMEGRSNVALPSGPAPGASKSRTPCFFYSQGFCAKGDKCPFMHGTPAASGFKAPTPQRPTKPTSAAVAAGATAAAPASALEPVQKESNSPVSNGGEAKSSVHVPSLDLQGPVEVKPSSQVSGAQSSQKDGRTVSVPGATQNGGPRGRAEGPVVTNSGLVGNRLRLRQVQPGDDRVQNGMEPDEWWEESSPGFDVLVDDGPEQSRYPDDPDFQSAGETGMDSEIVGAGNRSRGGRSMRMPDNMEQYDYDFPGPYDRLTGYDGAGPYDHGGYEYNIRDQQGGYDAPGAYDRTGHPRAGVYSERSSLDDMWDHDRMGLPMDVDMHPELAEYTRGPNSKRRRPDAGQHLLPESHSRRQRTEMPLDDYKQHHLRQQEDQQKQHELLLRHQLYMQQGIRSSGRRGQEKPGLDSSIIARRAFHDIGASDGTMPGPEKALQKSLPKARPLHEQGRPGTKDVEIHSRLSRGPDVYGEAEGRSHVDAEGTRKPDRQMKKQAQPSTFAGPKSLAEIRAEKKKGAAEESSKSSTALNGSRKSTPTQASSQPKPVSGRNQTQQSRSSSIIPDTPLDALSADEKKAKLDKEPRKVPNFEGPKSLSDILKEKRRESEPKAEVSNADRLQRHTASGRATIASTIETVTADVDSHAPEVQAGVGEADLGNTDVEDGELPSIPAGPREEANIRVHVNGAEGEAPSDQTLSNRERVWHEDRGGAAAATADQVEVIEEIMVEVRSNGVAVERNEEVDYTDGQEFDEDARDAGEGDQEEDNYAIDDEEDDDFAKKLGGFFS